MNAKIVRVVASLIAILALLGASQAARAQALWAGAQTVTAVEYSTQDDAGNCQVLSNGQTSCRFYLSAKTDEITALDSYAVRPGLQMKRTGNTVLGFAPGTPGTVTMRKFMFCLGGKFSNNPNLPEAERGGALRCGTAQTVYSHVNVPDKVREGNSENLVTNPNLAYFTQSFWNGYLEDQGNLGIAFVPPYKATINGKEYEFCPVGTREVRKWYNAAFQRASANANVVNDGNWRFTNQFTWRDSSLPKGYEQSYDDELFCGPAEVGKVWVNNDFPTDQVIGTGNEWYGSFVSRFTLGATPTTANATFHLNVMDTNRQNWFDNSRKIFVTPTYSARKFLTAKNAPAPVNATTNLTEVPQNNRQGVYVHERTGRVYQLVTPGGFSKVLVTPSGASLDANPKVLTQSVTSDVVIEGNVAGHIEGDLFFRVLSRDNFTAGRLEVHDLRIGEVGAKIAEYAIPFPLARSGALNDFRPRLSLDAKRGEMYILNQVVGRVFAVNLGTSVVREVTIANRNGDAIMDVAVDAANDKLYAIAQPTLGGTGNADNRFTYGGRFLEQSIVNGTALREVVTGAPTQFALGLVQGKPTAFVVNAVRRQLSEVDIGTFMVRRETPTEDVPAAIALEFKD